MTAQAPATAEMEVTPDPGPKEIRRILPESTPAIRIRSHLCDVVDACWTALNQSTLRMDAVESPNPKLLKY